jgi:pimeloyl-ACP methyl ester carboxylesterase
LLNVAGLTLDEQEIQDWLDQFAGRKLNRLARSTEDLIFNSTLIEDLSDTPPFSPHELAAIRCPTIAIFGENSDIFERGVLIEQLVPQAELRVVPESAHSVLTEHTREIRHLVLGWLAERSPAATGGG